MGNEHVQEEQIHLENQLMEDILKVRFTDLEAERELCKKLLGIAEPKHHLYACAFANVYLMDSHLALGEYESCNFYMMKANILCREYGFQDLLLTLLNCAGLYYLKLNDEQIALQHYLEGLKLAKVLGDRETESKIINNIGLGFAGRQDWVTAGEYFERAFQTIEPLLAEKDNGNAISYLGNLAEACEHMGEIEAAEQALLKCEELGCKSLYHQFRLICGWCSYYAKMGDTKRCAQLTDQLIELGFLEYENKFFVYDMLGGLCENMMEVNTSGLAGEFLKLLKEKVLDAPLAVQYGILRLEIQYKEKFEGGRNLEQAYHTFYDIAGKIAAMDHEARSNSMLSKIQLMEATLEWEHIYRESQELRHAGQVDELTGLYNRRYFNKLITKISQSRETYCLGFVMLDVDYFKQYNDYYGHFMGDNALRAVSNVLMRYAPKGIHACRYGGDEFVCLCENLSDDEVREYVNQVYEGLLRAQVPHKMSKCSQVLTLSIGYYNGAFDGSMNAEQILELADQALYRVKESGRNNYARGFRAEGGV